MCLNQLIPDPITPSPFKSTPNFFSTCFVMKSIQRKNDQSCFLTIKIKEKRQNVGGVYKKMWEIFSLLKLRPFFVD
jgi:hypothetical protein